MSRVVFETPSFVWFVLILGGLTILAVRYAHRTCSRVGVSWPALYVHRSLTHRCGVKHLFLMS